MTFLVLLLVRGLLSEALASLRVLEGGIALGDQAGLASGCSVSMLLRWSMVWGRLAGQSTWRLTKREWSADG